MKLKAAAVGSVLIIMGMGYLWYEASLAQLETQLARTEANLTVEQEAVSQLGSLVVRKQEQLDRSKKQLAQMIQARNAAEARFQAIEVVHAQTLENLKQLQKQDQELDDWSADPVPVSADDWVRNLITPATGSD
ncbi:hypothetical protein SAMN05660443_0238 [Marinospirillum celere]|uniref:Uncharacterized protein n=1 Tax=Marinospirillum celere TaxID=1122252 RepID=A0A1I1E0D9_9GAMM|nr:hypothetical protein [Marinospirillum celere]SFB80534.1 hypothetical protein SAMN05660443_0238 [Marinospirillum celere]